jgi:tRNA(His) 5'-end guanylyltransferase
MFVGAAIVAALGLVFVLISKKMALVLLVAAGVGYVVHRLRYLVNLRYPSGTVVDDPTVLKTHKPTRKERKNRRDPVGMRMKGLEHEQEKNISGDKPFCVRVDGHAFSKLRGFKTPFDKRFSAAMALAAANTMLEFGARSVEVHSDEASFFFDACTDKQTTLYNGKVQKLASLVASCFAVQFNKHLETLGVKIGVLAYFDGRVFELDDVGEYVDWRTQFDCRRNSVSMLGRAHLGHAAMQGLNSSQIVDKLREDKGVVWADLQPYLRQGAIIKRQRYTVKATNRKTGEPVTVLRSQPVARSIDVNAFDGVRRLMLDKYWPEDFDAGEVVFAELIRVPVVVGGGASSAASV